MTSEGNICVSGDWEKLLDRIRQQVRAQQTGEASGHDWWHTARVTALAKHLAHQEGANLLVVELAALLHDIADQKFHGGDEAIGPTTAARLLQDAGVEDEGLVQQVCHIVATLSYKGAGVPTPMHSLEGQVVQDADRLDALGAIGIARTFAYGGQAGRPIYDPASRAETHATAEAYKRGEGSSINHFHEKLLLLKERMNTDTAKSIAQRRHQVLEQFLDEFHREWEVSLD